MFNKGSCVKVKSSIDKDSKYRDLILAAVSNDESHPIHHGIDMQAHHIISAQGIKDSGKGTMLINMKYNINVLDNLVLLPCTLPGACHLGVQLHRGNHTFHDDEHPRSYHKDVALRLQGLEETFENKCSKNKSVNGLINKESVKILDSIAKFKLPLTRIFSSFNTTGEYKYVGCSNKKNVPDHNNNVKCNENRKHFNGVNSLKYKLKVGK